jgi:phosphoribosyl-ATP pyrophosphohydrolase
MSSSRVLDEIWETIGDRLVHPRPGSYVCSLMQDPKGIDKLLEKVGEEATEYIIAVKNKDPRRIISEAADLQFHLLLSLRAAGVDLGQLFTELESRRK